MAERNIVDNTLQKISRYRVQKTPILPSNADNGTDKGNSSSEENFSVHRST